MKKGKGSEQKGTFFDHHRQSGGGERRRETRHARGKEIFPSQKTRICRSTPNVEMEAALGAKNVEGRNIHAAPRSPIATTVTIKSRTG